MVSSSASSGEKEQQATLKNVIGMIPAYNPKRARENFLAIQEGQRKIPFE